jgi:hypothetical protein
MRSYIHLIKCQFDVNVAMKKLMNIIGEDLDYKSLLRFLHSFESVSDNDVIPRYQMHWQYGDYLSTFVTAFAFVFALVSAALSAMQVVLAAQQDGRVVLVGPF